MANQTETALKFGLTIKWIFNQNMKKVLIPFLILFSSVSIGISQNSSFSATDFTKKSITNYTQREYGDTCHTQNWSVVEDSRGIMHFGNRIRVLHYNGVNWDATRIPVDGGFVTSLAADSEENVYVGAFGEFGCLKPNEKGVLEYVSFSDSLAGEDSQFGQVWRTILYKEGVIFISYDKIFYWKDHNITVIEPETSFHLAFVADDELYVRQRGIGLMKYENEEFGMVPDGDIFKDYGIFGIFPISNEKKHIIITQEKGLFVYNFKDDHNEIQPIKTPDNDILIESRIIGSALLHNEKIALSTINSGVIIINSKGIIKDIIDQNTGMRDNDVKQVYQDKWNNLWMALNTGISKLDYSSPISFYDDNTGIYGSIKTITKHNNKLFVGTSSGLFVENTNITNNIFDHFTPISGLNKSIENLNSINDILVIGTHEGLYKYDTHGNFIQISDIDASSVNWSPGRNVIFAAGTNGFFIFDAKNFNLIKSYQDAIIQNSLNIAEKITEKKSVTELWIGTNDLGVLNFSIGPDLAIDHDHYFPGEAGLTDSWVQPFQYKGNVYFGVIDGLMEFIYYEENTPDQQSTNNRNLKGHFNFASIPVDSVAYNHWLYDYGKTWLCYDNQVAYMENDSNLVKEPFMGINFPRINYLLPVDSNKIWIATDDRLALVNTNWIKDYKAKPNINFYRIGTKNDSLLFKGYYTKKDHYAELSYDYNDITFNYASQFNENDYNAHYSYKLLGYNDEWSEWSQETRFGYTNLREGNYVFKVKARDLYGNESEAISFSFDILPPWYRTIAAYILYGLIAILIVYIIVRLSIMRLKAKNIQLENIIKKRTEEIRAQKDEIEKQHSIVLKQKEEITSSITYASRIQNALVPSDNFFNDNLTEHFILWMPRDIVSGDFYWGKKIGPYIFIVAADCTGHGVPGAFMSMLGIAFLNEIVQKDKIFELSNNKDQQQAAHVLEEMREHVKTTLRQTGDKNEQKDGMDLAFCALNTETNVLHYAGANSPLFLIRNNELIEHKPTRNPIGIHIRERSFENHKIKLQKNDVIYLFSDGYRDQFGGENEKKFGKKAFTELLMNIHQNPLDEQKQILKNNISEWMSNKHRQLDDILVIGFKID